jgi:hypothetical protein
MDWDITHQFECIGALPAGAPKTYEDITKRQAYYERLLASERYSNPKGVADKLQSAYYKKMRDQMERSRLRQAASGAIDPQEGLSATQILDETQGYSDESPRGDGKRQYSYPGGSTPTVYNRQKRESQARKTRISQTTNKEERARLKEEHRQAQMARGGKKAERFAAKQKSRQEKKTYRKDLKNPKYDKTTRLTKGEEYHRRQENMFRFAGHDEKAEKHRYKGAAKARKLKMKGMSDKKTRAAAKRVHLKEKKKFQKTQLTKHKEGSAKHAKATKKLANIKKRKGKLYS